MIESSKGRENRGKGWLNGSRGKVKLKTRKRIVKVRNN